MYTCASYAHPVPVEVTKEVSDPLELEIQIVVSCHPAPGSSARPASGLNREPPSLQPPHLVLFRMQFAALSE